MRYTLVPIFKFKATQCKPSYFMMLMYLIVHFCSGLTGDCDMLSLLSDNL